MDALTLTSPLSAHCRPLPHPHPPEFLLSLGLVLGILLSYLPQHAKIIRCATSEGLSP